MPAYHLNLVQTAIKRVTQYCSKNGSIFLQTSMTLEAKKQQQYM